MAGILDDIGCKIRKLRQRAGYTQREVSKLLNIERSTYSYYELGKIIPDLRTLINIANIFNEPLVNFLEEGNRNTVLNDSEWDVYKDNSDKKIYDEIESKESFQNENHGIEFTSDLSKAEKNIIMYFRMLSVGAQKRLSEIIEEKLENEKNFK